MEIIKKRHFWLILLLFVLLTLLHYIEQMGFPGTMTPSRHLGLQRHTLDRILFLVPIIYAAVIFRLDGGVFASVAALIAMLPRALFISPDPADAMLETVAVFFAGISASVLSWQRTKQQGKLEASLAEIRAAHEILQRLVQSLTDSERRQAILSAIAAALSESLDLRNILKKAVVMVSELMQVEVTLIFCLDEVAQELKLMAYEGISEAFAQTLEGTRISEGFYGEVVRTGQPKIVENVAQDPRLNTPEFEGMQIQIQLIIPLIYRDVPKGAIGVAMRRPRDFNPQDTELLTAVGRQIATAIENARLYEKERLTAERLAVSERNYRELFENARDAIWVHDLGGNIIAANQAAATLTGYSLEELASMKATDFLSSESLALGGEVRRNLIEKQLTEQPYTQHLIKKDGSKAILMLTSSLVIEDGKPTAFQHIARDVTKERQLQDNLRYYLQQITTAQEEERRRIARELHDETAQALYALIRRVDNLLRSNDNLPGECVTSLKELGQEVKNILQGVRRFSQDLRPSTLDDLGLLATLRWLLSDLKNHYQIETELKVIGSERRLPPQVELMLFRIVQEAVRNVEKHAQASKVEIEIDFNPDRIRLSVKDNGQGFKLAGNLGDLARNGRLGIAGMEERTHLLGGSLKIQTEPNKGTAVTVEVPAPP